MLWIILSLLTAFFHSSKDLLSKRVLQGVNEYVVVFGTNLFALPLLLYITSLETAPIILPQFLTTLLLAGFIDSCGTLLYLKGIKASDLSLSVPLMNFTPVFMLLTSPLLIGEFPNLGGILGMLLIVIGAWTLHIHRFKEGFFVPLRALLHEPGPRFLIFVALLWSINANIHKIGIGQSSPMYYTSALVGVRVLFLSLAMLVHSRANVSTFLQTFPRLIPLGILNALVFACQMTAMNLALVAYVISLKRLSVVFSVFFGALLFQEERMRARVVSSLVMLLGAVIITLVA